MKSLYEFGKEIVRIREAINSVKIKGRKNASLVVFACNRCDELIEEINQIARNAEEQASEQSDGEGGELNERNSGCS